MNTLSAKQQRFVEEYLKDPQNLTAAYKRAGYKACGHSAEVAASRLLKNVEIKAAIVEAQKEIRKETLVSVAYVIEGLREVAQRCLQRERVMVGSGKNRKPLVIEVTDPETGEQVSANAWTFDSSGANRAFELLGKHAGAFMNDEDIPDAPMPAVINVNVVDARRTA
jgi:phage terminase small subunit